MWRADRTDDYTVEPDDDDPGAELPVAVPAQMTAPHDLSVVAPTNVAEPAWAAWRDELALLGGASPLLHFIDSPRTRIELSTTHPGGLAQFITGRATLLSNLIRDDVALRAAKLAAGAVAQKGVELVAARGIEAVHLGIGIAEWRYGAVEYRAPVLLRPLAIRRHGRDFELKLRGTAYLNPAFARVLREQHGIELDAHAFVALTDDEGTFKPNPVIDRLRGLTGHLDRFSVHPRDRKSVV